MKLVVKPWEIPLTEFQNGQAIALRNYERINREIASILKIGKSAIAEFLKNPDAHRKRKKMEDPKKVMPKDQRKTLRQLKKRGSSIPTT